MLVTTFEFVYKTIKCDYSMKLLDKIFMCYSLSCYTKCFSLILKMKKTLCVTIDSYWTITVVIFSFLLGTLRCKKDSWKLYGAKVTSSRVSHVRCHSFKLKGLRQVLRILKKLANIFQIRINKLFETDFVIKTNAIKERPTNRHYQVRKNTKFVF